VTVKDREEKQVMGGVVRGTPPFAACDDARAALMINHHRTIRIGGAIGSRRQALSCACGEWVFYDT
jgi:hypothetical protein